jgi:hypothetical protein
VRIEKGVEGEPLPLTKSFGVVSGGTLATSVSSPKMEDGGGRTGEGPEDEDEQKEARSAEEPEDERGLEPRRRRSREENEERAMAGG